MWWKKSLDVGAVALLLCAAAGITVHQLTPAPAHTVPALAAARDLPAGAILGATDVSAVSVPPSVLSTGTFTSAAEVSRSLIGTPGIPASFLQTPNWWAPAFSQERRQVQPRFRCEWRIPPPSSSCPPASSWMLC